MKSYTPPNFHEQTPTTLIKPLEKNERRANDSAIARSIEIMESMNSENKRMAEESKAVNAEVRKMLDDAEKIIQIRFDQLDINIVRIHDDTRADMQLIREDNKSFLLELMARLEEKQATQDKRITAVEGCVEVASTGLSKRIDHIEESTAKKIDGLHSRVEALEQAPAKKAVTTVNTTKEKIIGAIIASSILGGGAVAIAVYNWVKATLENAVKINGGG